MTLDHKLDAPFEDHRADEMSQGVLGTEQDRPDGWLKVAGRATYAAETDPQGLLHGVLVRAPATGNVMLPNLAEVEAMPGVRKVMSHPKMIRNAAQGTANEAPVQGVDNADYVGQPVAIVVAETFERMRGARSDA